MSEAAIGTSSHVMTVKLDPEHESFKGYTSWYCEKWSDDAVDFAAKKLDIIKDAVSSSILRKYVGKAEEFTEVPSNLLLNEGIVVLLALLTASSTATVPYNAANSFIGVGDTATAASASQTELQASQNASNRFYKGMNSTYPSTSSQTTSWQSDFTTSEANFVWNEWSITAGATTSSGSGYLVGTNNLNRKVASLGTKTSGTWTLTGQITIS